MSPLSHSKTRGLPELVDSLQARGRIAFTKDDAKAALEISEAALKKAVQRQIAKGRLVAPRRGFYVIVPLEYRAAGAPPASWFIDELMKFHAQPYYVGLLSAAEIHGAAHQKPQVLQVVTNEQLRGVIVGRGRIQFLAKRDMAETPVEIRNTPTGTMRVSTPEATALDLFRFLRASGHLDHVATVLSELAEEIDTRTLAALAAKEPTLAHVQRLGHVMERVGAGRIAAELVPLIADARPRYVALNPGAPTRDRPKEPRWRIIVNTEIEAEV